MTFRPNFSFKFLHVGHRSVSQLLRMTQAALLFIYYFIYISVLTYKTLLLACLLTFGPILWTANLVS